MLNINININDDNFNDIYIYLLLSLGNNKPLIFNFEVNFDILNLFKNLFRFFTSKNIDGYKCNLNEIEIYIIHYKKSNRLTIYIKEEDYKKNKLEIDKFLNKMFRKEFDEKKLELNFIATNNDNIYVEKRYVKIEDIKKQFKLKYFSFLGIYPQKEVKKFFNSKESILILSGKPGVGKTKFISSLIYYTYYYYYNKVVFYYIKGLSSLYKFLKDYLMKNFDGDKTHYIILDDFDYLSNFNREIHVDSLEKEIISLILSLSDGFIEHKIKFIISSNARIKNIDPALLRYGRLYKLIKFDKINLKELLKLKNLNKIEKEIVNKLIENGQNEIVLSDLIKKIEDKK